MDDAGSDQEVGRGGYDMLAGVCSNGSNYERDVGAVMLVEGLQGDGVANVGANDDFVDGVGSENSKANEEVVNKILETSFFGDKNLTVQDDGEGYYDREDHMLEEVSDIDDEIMDNKCSRLDKQLMEIKSTSELAKESGALLYDEEDDFMAILQEQNE
ncbi:hypothetical protein AHAS_Ahas03G0127700 [Arachis hypogaea]